MVRTQEHKFRTDLNVLPNARATRRRRRKCNRSNHNNSQKKPAVARETPTEGNPKEGVEQAECGAFDALSYHTIPHNSAQADPNRKPVMVREKTLSEHGPAWAYTERALRRTNEKRKHEKSRV